MADEKYTVDEAAYAGGMGLDPDIQDMYEFGVEWKNVLTGGAVTLATLKALKTSAPKIWSWAKKLIKKPQVTAGEGKLFKEIVKVDPKDLKVLEQNWKTHLDDISKVNVKVNKAKEVINNYNTGSKFVEAKDVYQSSKILESTYGKNWQKLINRQDIIPAETKMLNEVNKWKAKIKGPVKNPYPPGENAFTFQPKRTISPVDVGVATGATGALGYGVLKATGKSPKDVKEGLIEEISRLTKKDDINNWE